MDCGRYQKKAPNALPLFLVNHPENSNQELIKYIISCKNWDIKLAPSYTLYLLALNHSASNSSNLKKILINIAISIHAETESSDTPTSKLIFWLVNVSELFIFFKYDQHLMDKSEEALTVLENTIKTLFLCLLSTSMHFFETYTKEYNFEHIKKMLEKFFVVMKDSMVNIGIINQLYSYLLQWVAKNLIENIYNNPESSERYFMHLKTFATAVADEYLMNVVEKYEDLLEDKRVKHYTGKKKLPSGFVKLCWRKPDYLEYPCAVGYIDLIEEGSKRLSQIIEEKHITLNKNLELLKLCLPRNGFSSYYLKGTPEWLANFLNGIQDKQFCYFSQLKDSNEWDVFLKGKSILTHHVDVKFDIPPCPDKKDKVGGIYIAWSNLDDFISQTLNVGEKIFSINNKVLISITQKEAEKIVRNNNGNVKIEVLKNDSIWILPETQTETACSSHHEASSSKEKNEGTSSRPDTPPQTKEISEEEKKLQNKAHVNFISDIRKKVDDLDKMLEEFDGVSDKDRNYVYMKEIMMRSIIRLDNMETAMSEEVMNLRRDTIYFIQQKTQLLMTKLEENKKVAEIRASGKNKESTKLPENTKSTETISVSIRHPLEQCGDDPVEFPEHKESLSEQPVKQSKNTLEGNLEKTMCETKLENMSLTMKKILVCETRYDLDEFGKTYLSIGIYPCARSGRNKQVIKFGNTDGHSIILEYTDWHLFLSFQHLIKLHFDTDHQPFNQTFGENFLKFEVQGLFKFVTVLCGSNFISLTEENLKRLFELDHLIEKRFNTLTMLNFDNYYLHIISKAVEQEGDRIRNITRLVQCDMNKCTALSCAYAMMEIVEFYPEMLIKDVGIKPFV